jgi:dTDP-4-dehydrorhamnose reductase
MICVPTTDSLSEERIITQKQTKLRVLVLGATGMLGSTIFRILSADNSIETFGTLRAAQGVRRFAHHLHKALIPDIQVGNESGVLAAFAHAKPHVVINCIGIIKQLPEAYNHLESLAINSILPHRLAKYCGLFGARFIHFSTDCVFSGKSGQYRETDPGDATDLYGRTKLLGEVDYEHALTLRTSIIGHELTTNNSLIDWFLSQTDEVRGFRKAFFSGMPTVEIAQVVRDMVIPNPSLRGLYHLSVDSIDKNELLRLVAETYSKDIVITPDDELVIDRSLNSDRFRTATGFEPKPWPELIRDMHADYVAVRRDAM